MINYTQLKLPGLPTEDGKYLFVPRRWPNELYLLDIEYESLVGKSYSYCDGNPEYTHCVEELKGDFYGPIVINTEPEVG